MEYLDNKFVSTGLGLLLVSNLYEFSPKMPLIVRKYRNNIFVQFVMIFLFCLLLIKDLNSALLLSIAYLALFFLIDKLEGFENMDNIENLEELENYANIKEEHKNK